MFLLVSLGSIVCGQHLIESVLEAHVKQLVDAEIPNHTLLESADASTRLTRHLIEHEATRLTRRDRAVIVRDSQGHTRYGPSAPWIARFCADPRICTSWHALRLDDGTRRAEWLGRGVRLGDGGLLIVAYDIMPMLERLYPVTVTAGVGIFVVLIASLGTGLYFSFAAARRIDRIRTAMQDYGRGDTEARVPMRAAPVDEFDRLGMDINAALARINVLMDEVRNTTNHIAHELRTPLTHLQHRLATASEETRDESALLEIALAQEEAARIQQIFRAVMRISELESGRSERVCEPVDLAALIGDVISYYQWQADERGIGIGRDIDPGCRFSGDHALLMQALANLVDNALKYAPDGPTLAIIARRGNGFVTLGVADCGPGISRLRAIA